MTAQELIAKVLELDAKATKGPWGHSWDSNDLRFELVGGILQSIGEIIEENNTKLVEHYRTAAPILARLCLKLIEQRNNEGIWIQSGDPRERWKKYDVELDRIAKGEE